MRHVVCPATGVVIGISVGADGFYRAVWYFVFIIIFAAPVVALSQFVESRLVLEWRRWLCADLLKLYFKNCAFFKLHINTGKIDNPDQVNHHSRNDNVII